MIGSFKNYLTEFDNITVGQAKHAHETPVDSSISISNIKIRNELNYQLFNELSAPVTSIQIGIQKIRKVLHAHGLDIPVLYELDPEGDETVFEMNQYGVKQNETVYLYLIYSLSDDGYYDFHSELIDEEGLEEIISEDDDEEK
jgi:hypothetical protein